MFRGCSKLKYLDIGNFDMSKSERAEYLVNECDALDILITPKNMKKASECKLPHTMYDRNGKAYSQLPKKVLKSPFKDVPSSHTFYKAILWGYQKRVTTGYTSGPKKGTFGINENCTRGQIVTFLYRARNL